MDPNETLKMIRKLSNEWEDMGTDFMSPEEVDSFIGELLENVIALDQWLTNGGFRPEDWS
jgi:hypothetical protein